MSSAPISSPPDLSVLLTNLGILVAAIAAVIGGVWTGWQRVKTAIKEEATASGITGSQSFQVLKATITETTTLLQLTESNRNLTEAVESLDRIIGDLVVVLRDNKRASESQGEEAHRLRIAVKDLYEQFRSFRQ